MNKEIYKITGNDVLHQLVNLRQVTFEVTDACNLKCTYCGYGYLYEGHDAREDKYMPLDMAYKLIDYLVDVWSAHSSDIQPRNVNVGFYGGEPLLNIDFIKNVISYIEQQNIPNRTILYSMTTNAMLLDRHMGYLVEKKFRLLISLDGNRVAHSYRVNHSGENSFDKVLHNVMLLKEQHAVYFDEFVSFNSVLTNRGTVEDVHTFIFNTFGKIPNIAELNNSGIKKEKEAEYGQIKNDVVESINRSKDYKRLSEQMFLSDPYVNGLSIFLRQASGNFFLDYNSLLVDQDKRPTVPTGTCWPFQKKMFVTVNGKIIQCERIDHIYALGRITQDGVELNYEKIAARFNSYLSSIQFLCKSCSKHGQCTQCVYYVDHLGSEHARCNGYMTQKEHEKYILSNVTYMASYPKLYKKLTQEVLIDF